MMDPDDMDAFTADFMSRDHHWSEPWILLVLGLIIWSIAMAFEIVDYFKRYLED